MGKGDDIEYCVEDMNIQVSYCLSEESFSRVFESQNLLANIPAYKYARYLLLFNDWFIKNGTLPETIEQLQYMGIDEYQSIYDIDSFVNALYEACDDKSVLDDAFNRFFLFNLS